MNESLKIETATSSIDSLLTAVRMSVVTIIALGLIYPAVITGVAQLAMPQAADGSLLYAGPKLIGTANAGQLFGAPQYFHGRPSAAGTGYDPTQTGGTNLGPTSKKLMDSIQAAAIALRKDNPAAAALPLPTDLLTSSASGLDPDISPEAAYFQAARVATARKLSVDEIRIFIIKSAKPRFLGIFGEPHVNVLDLNRALDAHERPQPNVSLVPRAGS